MKVIGICGSPRKGNTEWMLGRVLEAARHRGADTELVLLREKNIGLCDGCLSCEVGGQNREGICHLKDDMSELYPSLVAADAWVLGTPVYFELLSALLKNFMDRTCPIWPRLKGKVVAATAVAEAGIGQAVANIKTYASLCRMEFIGSVTALGRDPHDVSKDEAVARELWRLGESLVQAVEAKQAK